MKTLLNKYPNIIKFIKFGFIGLLNTLVFNGIYNLFLYINLFYIIALTLAYIISIYFSYFLNAKFVHDVKITMKTALLFPLTYIPNYIITTGGAIILVQSLNVDKRIAAFIASLIAIPITFVIQKYMFDKTKPQE